MTGYYYIDDVTSDNPLYISYIVGLPNPISSSDTKYGPAKSLMTPDEVQIPIWPMNGTNQLQINQIKNNKSPSLP
jgi:hypothetical protein